MYSTNEIKASAKMSGGLYFYLLWTNTISLLRQKSGVK